jgi:hypothetical protein
LEETAFNAGTEACFTLSILDAEACFIRFMTGGTVVSIVGLGILLCDVLRTNGLESFVSAAGFSEIVAMGDTVDLTELALEETVSVVLFVVLISISLTKLKGKTPIFPVSSTPVHQLIEMRKSLCYPSSSFDKISSFIPFFKFSSSGCCAT